MSETTDFNKSEKEVATFFRFDEKPRFLHPKIVAKIIELANWAESKLGQLSSSGKIYKTIDRVLGEFVESSGIRIGGDRAEALHDAYTAAGIGYLGFSRAESLDYRELKEDLIDLKDFSKLSPSEQEEYLNKRDLINTEKRTMAGDGMAVLTK